MGNPDPVGVAMEALRKLYERFATSPGYTDCSKDLFDAGLAVLAAWDARDQREPDARIVVDMTRPMGEMLALCNAVQRYFRLAVTPHGTGYGAEALKQRRCEVAFESEVLPAMRALGLVDWEPDARAPERDQAGAVCPRCRGTGDAVIRTGDCGACGGTGKAPVCKTCGDDGLVYPTPAATPHACPDCDAQDHGTGARREAKEGPPA